MLVALAVDATLFSGPHGRWTSNKPRPFLTMMLQARLLIKHFVVVSFLGLGVMSLCVSDLGLKHSVLPEDFRVFALFVSILLIWISL